ncbi:MAG: ATP-binding protein [Planctomycetes bacterium]|nr:ATP-binding protein [Planctomycetota bacterium]
MLTEAVLRGDRVEIERLVSLSAAEEKASVAQGEAGNRIITPARKVLSFALHADLKAQLGDARKLAFLPDPSLRDRIARLKASTILLVVPAEDFFTKTMAYHFRRAGWDFRVTTDCQKAIEQVEGGETYQVIYDDPMPNSQALLERLKGDPATSRVPVIAMMPAGSDAKAVEGFRICPDQVVIQPFEVKALLDKAENELARVAEEKAIFRQEVLFRFATIDKCVDRANEFGAKLFEKSGLDDEGQVAFCAAFRESIGNAAQHGNRYRKDKFIEILYLLDSDKITANVTDQGKGFDHKLYTNRGAGGDAIAAARERHQQGRLGGLGIMLMMKCTDKLEYNDAGNSVTLTKLLKKKA